MTTFQVSAPVVIRSSWTTLWIFPPLMLFYQPLNVFSDCKHECLLYMCKLFACWAQSRECLGILVRSWWVIVRYPPSIAIRTYKYQDEASVRTIGQPDKIPASQIQRKNPDSTEILRASTKTADSDSCYSPVCKFVCWIWGLFAN
jgi:hypothetical protein